jgi:hypothetical protein
MSKQKEEAISSGSNAELAALLSSQDRKRNSKKTHLLYTLP